MAEDEVCKACVGTGVVITVDRKHPTKIKLPNGTVRPFTSDGYPLRVQVCECLVRELEPQ